MSEMSALEGRGPPSAILAWSKSGVELASRRGQALADYWIGLATARQPEDAIALQLDYWTHWIDDYAMAAAEALSPFTPSQPDEASAARPH